MNVILFDESYFSDDDPTFPHDVIFKRVQKIGKEITDGKTRDESVISQRPFTHRDMPATDWDMRIIDIQSILTIPDSTRQKSETCLLKRTRKTLISTAGKRLNLMRKLDQVKDLVWTTGQQL